MHSARPLLLLLAFLSVVSLSGCLMPNRGTPVFVDMRAGAFWSGRGMLMEVTPDQQRCRVAVRDRSLVVRRVWTDCTRVHPRLGG
jgi:hypothetical protein